MAADPELIAYLRDLFSGLGPISMRRMFSGAGLYAEDDAMFCLVARDTVYLKTDADTRPLFEAAGSEPFAYEMNGRRRALPSFMTLPEAAMDDAEEALHWARLALPPARAAAAEKRAEKARKAARRAGTGPRKASPAG
ncbi:TfoX/Sxy family protein [Acidimangrovimonas sediminis]|uniref:TfoX/Sxy family protein n=1 Tax=Acidimangrovimonas sediminis TaxID=2056283 RepID=UPI000C7FC001|nr:TfoX/Sxy family protein [Acidimangrovimonas sediminis]